MLPTVLLYAPMAMVSVGFWSVMLPLELFSAVWLFFLLFGYILLLSSSGSMAFDLWLSVSDRLHIVPECRIS